MAKLRKIFILTACLLALGARPVSAAVDSHLAVRVDVLYAWEQGALLRQYTGQEKMGAVLNYLRLAQYAGMPEDDPLRQKGDTCRIRVHLATGGMHQYLLHAGQFLCRDDEPWEVVELQQPLLPLLRALPSDG
jgi:hypothetical protein